MKNITILLRITKRDRFIDAVHDCDTCVCDLTPSLNVIEHMESHIRYAQPNEIPQIL